MKRPVTSGAETTNPAAPAAPSTLFSATGSAADPAAAPAPGLDGIPRQRPLTVSAEGAHLAAAESVPAAAERAPSTTGSARPLPARLRRVRPWRLFPTPTGTPFTFGYAVVLAVTSVVAEYADPNLVDRVLQASSTDVAHLAQSPVRVLVASALWIAGGLTSAYVIAFLLVLTALERRIGGWRTAGVFLLGHGLATLATEIPVGLSVLAGHLPESSLHRYDYGISFGVAASVGALAGLLRPWLRWTVLAVFGWMVIGDLIAFTDPMTNWGHTMALAIGVATWPLLRRVSSRTTTGTTETPRMARACP
ncbi:rhomboid-like protein [Streptomyces phaeochromogenes]|uniref:rhomboid-like protein n=1 Tax=Streptomyces phaeochromogenes TaxID=1923 RepID=UPI001FE17361|nr:rhomboid-like protein [Streptomyces phaeochromogenes]